LEFENNEEEREGGNFEMADNEIFKLFANCGLLTFSPDAEPELDLNL
jgi:hypothetical protein